MCMGDIPGRYTFIASIFAAACVCGYVCCENWNFRISHIHAAPHSRARKSATSPKMARAIWCVVSRYYNVAPRRTRVDARLPSGNWGSSFVVCCGLPSALRLLPPSTAFSPTWILHVSQSIRCHTHSYTLGEDLVIIYASINAQWGKCVYIHKIMN